MTGPVMLTYRGPARLAWVLASILEREGLTVRWSPTTGNRSVGQQAVVIVDMTVSGAAVASIPEATRAGIAKFKKRFPGEGTVEGEPTTHPPST